MVTSETSDSERQPSIETEAQEPTEQRVTLPVLYDTHFSYEALKRVLASDLLRAELTGRRGRLSGDEARRLSEAVLQRLDVPRADTSNLRDDLARLTAASWLGIGGQLNVPIGPATGQSKRINITRFREDAQGYEEIVSAHEDFHGQTRDLYDITWIATLSGCSGSFELIGLSLTPKSAEVEDDHDGILRTWVETAKRVGMTEDWIQARRQDFQTPNYGPRGPSWLAGDDTVNSDNVDWKAKYQALEFGGRMAKGEVNRFRQRVLERLLDVVI
jgi:hypothetical protein